MPQSLFIAFFFFDRAPHSAHFLREPVKRKYLFLIAICAVLVSALATLAQSIPAFKAKALDESEVVLPKPGGQQVIIILMGFSKKSGEVCEPWGKHLIADYSQDALVSYYQIAHLEGAPSFVRPMILRGMRKSLSPQEQAHFAALYENQAEWKKLVNFSNPDDAYLIVADTNGRIVWQTHGGFSVSSYDEFKKTVTDLKQKSEHHSF